MRGQGPRSTRPLTRSLRESRLSPQAGRGEACVGARIPRLDGWPKVAGSEKFGADEAPAEALWLRVVRSPHARAAFALGDLEAFRAGHPGLEAIVTAADVPGENAFGIFPDTKDQPVFADGEVRFRGEAVLGLVGTREALDRIDDTEVPIAWTPLVPLSGIEAALADGAPALHAARPDNVLTRGRLRCGDPDAGDAQAAATAKGTFRTRFVEHAYIEPEAGYAAPAGPDTIEIVACTQAPYMDRDETARVLGIPPENVRIRPSGCGGGFGGKLDVSVQPLARGRGLEGAPAGAHGLFARRVDGLLDEAASGDDPRPRLGRRARPAPRLRERGRFQHRRLRLLGTDGRKPRAGACERPLSRPERREPHARDLHQRPAGGRLPRLRRSAGGDRP